MTQKAATQGDCNLFCSSDSSRRKIVWIFLTPWPLSEGGGQWAGAGHPSAGDRSQNYSVVSPGNCWRLGRGGGGGETLNITLATLQLYYDCGAVCQIAECEGFHPYSRWCRVILTIMTPFITNNGHGQRRPGPGWDDDEDQYQVGTEPRPWAARPKQGLILLGPAPPRAASLTNTSWLISAISEPHSITFNKCLLVPRWSPAQSLMIDKVQILGISNY